MYKISKMEPDRFTSLVLVPKTKLEKLRGYNVGSIIIKTRETMRLQRGIDNVTLIRLFPVV